MGRDVVWHLVAENKLQENSYFWHIMERSRESRDSSVGLVAGLRDGLPRSSGSIPAGATGFCLP